jgi:Secretion system C-terminal sorting domain
MKQKIKNRYFSRSVFFAGLLAVSMTSVAQRASVTADPELGAITLANETGFAIDASQVLADQVISIKIPVKNDNHGQAVPAGSCKVKIGLGSKLVLDPAYNLNNTALGNYFSWSAVTVDGQSQITGDLVNPLPANVTSVNVAFKVKASNEGNSTITANFLITNHNTNSILSDEDGTNNGSFLQYRVVGKVAPINTDKLELSLYPNPIKDVKTAMIKVVQGELKGKYNITLMDISGRLMQSNMVELNTVTSFKYNFGNIAAGKYLLKVAKEDATQSFLLKFEKL